MSQPFETQTCTRCAGSGKFSFNLMHGDRCYGCGGTGHQFTARGKAAKAHFTSLLQRKVADLKVGEFVKTWVVLGGSDVWCIVEAIREDALNPGMVYIDLKSIKSGRGMTCGQWLISDVTSVVSQADLDAKKAEAVAYQATLTKAGKVSKKAK
jgi:hypothetical protein